MFCNLPKFIPNKGALPSLSRPETRPVNAPSFTNTILGSPRKANVMLTKCGLPTRSEGSPTGPDAIAKKIDVNGSL